MWTFTAHNLWAHKRRLVSTVLAVGLGVAFLAGTLLLSDTLRANFDRLFTQAWTRQSSSGSQRAARPAPCAPPSPQPSPATGNLACRTRPSTGPAPPAA